MRIIFFLFSFSALFCQTESVPFTSERWKMSDSEGTVIENYMGEESLFLKSGVAWLDDLELENGIIEVDINFSNVRSFPGIIFRLQDFENFEDFYVRPHQSGNQDATQYTPVFNRMAGWQLYSGEGFNVALDYEYDKWIHLKLIISGKKGEVYIGENPEPVLVIHELKHKTMAGKICLKAPARYANFSYTKTDNPSFRGEFKDPVKAEKGTVTKWAVSSVFNENSLEDKLSLEDSDINSLDWTFLECESTGLANLARVGRWEQDKNTVFAKINITAEKDMLKKINLAFSDRIKVYFNGKLLYSGHDEFRSRDYRFLGTIGYYDAIYLPLKEGDNELTIAVSENFGGWGIKALFEDMEGIEVSADEINK